MIEKYKSKSFIIFGAGMFAKEVISECEKNNIQIAYILDNDDRKENTIFQGYVVKKPRNINLKENEIIVIASSFSVEIQKQLKKMNLIPSKDYINSSLIFPYIGNIMKLPGKYDELTVIGDMVSSGVDDVGIVLRKGSTIYRAIFPHSVEKVLKVLNILKKRDFYQGKIIETKIGDKTTENFPLILEHPFIPYCSDTRSWAFSMINDAFDSIVVLLKELDQDNLTLKDAHGLNITYYKQNFCWIDFGSIIEGKLSYFVLKQLLEWFLFPCILIVNGFSKAFYEHNYKGRIQYFMVRSFLNERGIQLFDEIYNNADNNLVISGLLDQVQEWRNDYYKSTKNYKKTIWEDYQNRHYNDTEQMTEKEKVVLDFIKCIEHECKNKTLLDIAGNKGWFCYSTNKLFNFKGLLIDYDHNCIDSAYRIFKKESIDFIPLVNDFNNFPENLFFTKYEIKYNIILCLAFIHHLIFSNGFTFERIRDVLYRVTEKYLIIEFIDPSDEHVYTWMNQYFDWYNKKNFEKVFLQKYDILLTRKVSDSREIFLMKKK